MAELQYSLPHHGGVPMQLPLAKQQSGTQPGSLVTSDLRPLTTTANGAMNGTEVNTREIQHAGISGTCPLMSSLGWSVRAAVGSGERGCAAR